MMVYVDTSAFLAVMDGSDKNHLKAKTIWTELLSSGVLLLCASYVLVETYALIQRRLGMEALRVFHEDVFPLLRVEWVGEKYHIIGASAAITANRRGLSLVDCTSFAVMRELGIPHAFSFDKHFLEQGFALPPL